MQSKDRKPSSNGFSPVRARIYSIFASVSGKHRLVYATIIGDLAIHPGGRILEIGCGPGILASMLASKLTESTIYAVDPSATMVDISNRRFSRMNVSDRVRASVGNSSDPGIDGAFDLIYASLSFHHWNNRERDLEKLLNKLSTGGSLMIYESLVSDRAENGHGISRNFVESISFSGFEKTFVVLDNLISLKFMKTK